MLENAQTFFKKRMPLFVGSTKMHDDHASLLDEKM